ncbi:MAG: roadblock/LC7 domain-containing protein [Pyrinomonadaceae bacterium]
MEVKEQLNNTLAELLGRNSDIQSVVMATSDGITLTSVNLNDKSNRLAAMAAAALGLGNQVIATCQKGELEEILISGNKGKIFVYSISNNAVMVIVTKENPNVAMVNWEAKKTISQILELD